MREDYSIIEEKYYYDQFSYPILVPASNYSAGEKLRMQVFYQWQLSPTPDFTLKVYSKQNLIITDASNHEPNMWHMDGQYPSRFTWSSYNTDTTDHTAPFKPDCLYDVILAATSFADFIRLIQLNPWTLLLWYW